MLKKNALNISSVAMAIAAFTCLYVVINGEEIFSALGILLCTVVIYICNLAAYMQEQNQKEDRDQD